MTVPPPDPDGRPRTVTAAFSCWLTGAILTAGVGLLMLTQSLALLKGIGLLLVVVGLALGFLADKARKRDPRFARAAVALAMAAVAFLALVVLFLTPALGLVAIIGVAVLALIAGSALNQRPASIAWYHPDGVK